MATTPDRPLRAPGRLARFGELRAGIQPARLALRSPSLRGRALRTRHVILLPGFGTTDRALVPLRSYLRSLGHQALGWDIGRHGKDVESSVERFLPVVERRVDAAGEPVVLVGWSLGGIVARELSRDRPDLVSAVITMGSPLAGPRHTGAARAYTPAELDQIEALIAERRSTPLTVPLTAIYSRRDGVVDWRSCVDDLTPGAENIEVGSTHIGYSLDPDVWQIVRDRIATAPG